MSENIYKLEFICEKEIVPQVVKLLYNIDFLKFTVLKENICTDCKAKIGEIHKDNCEYIKRIS